MSALSKLLQLKNIFCQRESSYNVQRCGTLLRKGVKNEVDEGALFIETTSVYRRRLSKH